MKWNQINTNNIKQTRKIRKQFLSLISGNLFIFMLFSFYLASIDRPIRLWPIVEKYWLFFVIIVGIITIIIAPFIRKAKIYWSIFFVCGAFSLFILSSLFSFELLNIALGENSIYLMLGILFVSFSSFLSQTRVDITKLKLAEKYNQRSGLLDLENGFIDLTKKVLWDTPVNEEKLKQKAERLNKLSYIAPAIGFYIARNTSRDNTPLVYSVFLLYFTILCAFGGSRPSSMIFYLAEKEKVINKNIVFCND